MEARLTKNAQQTLDTHCLGCMVVGCVPAVTPMRARGGWIYHQLLTRSILKLGRLAWHSDYNTRQSAIVGLKRGARRLNGAALNVRRERYCPPTAWGATFTKLAAEIP